ncbi:hypothetical protein NG895_02725 [Aeoliella sp. ICT_H6.2]|uniref:Uncharacterized protein n=1 Tax=Aeoliella straminimaris TaxID=2954799 RepID=A0A9X2F5V3_9BACT|nr:hypothetical protein [Aeoliella straminimaris]MCO6042812.1 hypothetical protein [Aeoliella straminimaris]
MSIEQVYENAESKYGTNSFQQIRSNGHSKRRAPQGRRRGKTPQSFNGMHRRRRKKVSW